MRTWLAIVAGAGAVVLGGQALYVGLVHPAPPDGVLSQVLVIPSAATGTALGPAVSTSVVTSTGSTTVSPSTSPQAVTGEAVSVEVVRVRIVVNDAAQGGATRVVVDGDGDGDVSGDGDAARDADRARRRPDR